MAKKKKSVQLPVIKAIVVGLLAIVIGLFLCQRIFTVFKSSGYFSIQSIIIDSSLSFINKRELSNLKDKNIFSVDLVQVQKHLSFKYPQVSDIRVIRKFPNQIHIKAKTRFPLAQVQSAQDFLTLDENGIVLSSSTTQDKKIPLLDSREKNAQYTLGLPLPGSHYKKGLEILKYINRNHALSSYEVEFIDLTNMSKIELLLSNKLQVIFDETKIDQKVRILGVILAQGKVDLKEAKYVDLRFKEPIVGKK